MSMHHRAFHEWPVQDRRRSRTVELVVPADIQQGSVVFETGARPRRVLPLAIFATCAVLGMIQGTAAIFRALEPVPGAHANLSLPTIAWVRS